MFVYFRKRLEKLKLHEYFVVTDESLVDDFMNKLKAVVIYFFLNFLLHLFLLVLVIIEKCHAPV